MKLAEALRLKADLAIQISRLSSRIEQEMLVEEDEETTTEVYSLLKGYDSTSGRLLRLNVAINKANMENTVTYPSYYDNIKDFLAIGDSVTNTISDKVHLSTKTVMEALAERERLMSDISGYKSFQSRSQISPRYNTKAIKQKSNLDASKLRKRVDAMSKYLRLTDSRIQENNWLVEFEFE